MGGTSSPKALILLTSNGAWDEHVNAEWQEKKVSQVHSSLGY